MPVVKGRIREDVEARHLLDDAQHGFRTWRITYSACMAILAAYEDAIRRGIPLHGIFLEIRKAHDTVERGAGKGLALARLAGGGRGHHRVLHGCGPTELQLHSHRVGCVAQA